LFYNVQIVLQARRRDPDLEIIAILIAASVISENERTTIEQGLSTAMINVMDSIEAQYNFRIQTKKAAIKETFLTREGFMEAALSDEDEEVCSNVKQQLVRVQNKESADDGAITDTALLYNDNVFELPLAKQTKRKRNSNKQLAFRNLRSVFIMRRTYS
jgi:hypothetical protein